MLEEEIARVEDRFGIELPMPYRQLLLSYPDSLRNADASKWEVLDDADQIISINELIEASHMIGMPDSFFAIGESGCGDFYGIDVNESDGEVYFWNHEIAEIVESEGFPTIEEFAGYFLRPRRPPSKRWWQFWLER